MIMGVTMENKIFKIIIIVLIIGGVLFFVFSRKDDYKSNTIESINGKDIVEEMNRNIKFKELDKTITNELCNSKNKKVNYTLKLENGEVIINNLDNFMNFSLKKVTNVKAITSVLYGNSCDQNSYVILSEGKIYFTNNNIVNINNLDNLDDEFILLETEEDFDDLLIGEDNKLYSHVGDKLFRISLDKTKVIK